MAWLFWPCDTLETRISVLTMLFPALLRRLGSHPEIGCHAPKGLCWYLYSFLHSLVHLCAQFFPAPVLCANLGFISPAALLRSVSAQELSKARHSAVSVSSCNLSHGTTLTTCGGSTFLVTGRRSNAGLPMSFAEVFSVENPHGLHPHVVRS